MKNGFHSTINGDCTCGSRHEHGGCLYRNCRKPITFDIRHEDDLVTVGHNGFKKAFRLSARYEDTGLAEWVAVDCHPKPSGPDVAAASAYFK